MGMDPVQTAVGGAGGGVLGVSPATGTAPKARGFTAAAPSGAKGIGSIPSASANAATTAMVAVDGSAAAERVENPIHDIDRDQQNLSPLVARLPLELDVMVPVRDFRVRHLLALEAGQVIKSQWGHGEDVPLAAGKIALAWTEFEVIDGQLAVRITRLS